MSSKIIPLMLIALVSSNCLLTLAYWPTSGWTTSEPEEQSMDAALLQNASDYLNANHPFYNTLIVRNGYIVMEQSNSGENATTNILSATKSITATLVGVAIQQGFIDSTNQTMISFFPGRAMQHMDSRKESITLEHLLTMTGGFDYKEHNCSYSSPENSWYKMTHNSDMIQYMLDLPVVEEPGTHWEYSTGTSNLLGAIIEQASGMTLEEFASLYLFEKIGVTSVSWWRTYNGIHAGTGLTVSTRSLASIAYLYMNRGNWDGEQIFPQEWVDNVLSTRVRNLGQSEHLVGDLGYSYQWWNLEEAGLYFAWGSNGYNLHTRVYLMPSESLIAVFSGSTLIDESEFIMAHYILPSLGVHQPGPSPYYLLLVLPLLAMIPLLIRKKITAGD